MHNLTSVFAPSSLSLVNPITPDQIPISHDKVLKRVPWHNKHRAYHYFLFLLLPSTLNLHLLNCEPALNKISMKLIDADYVTFDIWMLTSLSSSFWYVPYMLACLSPPSVIPGLLRCGSSHLHLIILITVPSSLWTPSSFTVQVLLAYSITLFTQATHMYVMLISKTYLCVPQSKDRLSTKFHENESFWHPHSSFNINYFYRRNTSVPRRLTHHHKQYKGTHYL